MAAMCPQPETLAGPPGRPAALPGVSQAAGGRSIQKERMTERRRSAPSVMDKTLQLRVEDSPSSYLDPNNYLPFVSPERKLLMDCQVELKRGLLKHNRHLFLYDDLFIVTKLKSNNKYKIKFKVRVSDMWVSTCIEDTGEKNLNTMRSFIFGWPIVNFIATFSSVEQKEKWFTSLQRYVNLEKEKDTPKNIPLKVYTQDVDNCAHFKTVTVKNSETVVDVIKTSLSELGLTGSEKDYQLWVHPGKQAAPYPLIGHEFPYSIKKSYLRSNIMAQGPEEKVNTSPLLQESLLTELLPPEMQCQFILKPSRRAAVLTVNGHRIFRRRRSVINWAFWRSPNTQIGDVIDPPSPGKLFGISLPDICINDNLPTPVMNMLWLLYERGPETKGIFRQSANMKACRELKEKLDSGTDVQFDCESLFVVASVFKQFLRSIPGSIFSSNLFDHWVSILDEVDDEERIHTIQILLEQLPRANVIVLKYLFGVLHCIEQNSSVNQMNAFNLSICIGPSVLWPPTTSTPDRENDLAKKVSHLIQFFIENCYEIFGEEILSVFGEVSKKYESKESIADSCVRLDDSYDSLEDFYTYDASCSDVQKLGKGSRSLDSFLTCSDNDMDTTAASLLSLSNLSLTCSREDLEVDAPIGDSGEDSVIFPDPSLGSYPKDSSCTDSFIAGTPKATKRQRHSSEPALDIDPSPKVSVPQETPKGTLVANTGLFPNLHLGNHNRVTSGGDLVRSAYSAASLCTASDHKTPNDTEVAHPPRSSILTAPGPGRWQRRSSEPTPHSLGTRLSSFKEFYQKKFHKNSSDEVLPPAYMESFGQNSLKTEKPHLKGFGASKRNIFTISIKKTSPTKYFKFFSNTITLKSYDSISTIGQGGNESVVPDPPRSSPAPTSTRRNQHSSEPSTKGQPFEMTSLVKPQQPNTEHLNEEDCLKRHKSLQLEGQKLIHQSLVMGIEVGKSNDSQDKENTFSNLHSCPPRACSSSLSSLDTSLSGSYYSQDSMFSLMAEPAVLPTSETTCTGKPTLQVQRVSEDLPLDTPGASPDSEMARLSSGQARTSPTHVKRDTLGWHSVTLHPSTWLRSGLATLKNWSLNKKTRTTRPEEKSPQRGTMDFPRPSTSQEALEVHCGFEANIPEFCMKEGGDSKPLYSMMTQTLTEDKGLSQAKVPPKAFDAGDQNLTKDI